MRYARSAFTIAVAALCTVFAVVCAPSAAQAEKRVALVVGNGAYVHVSPLTNPRNDALSMKATLTRLGFEVYGGNDLDRSGLVHALVSFGRAAEQADVALIYYAGHGVQINGQNYLVPVDANVDYEAEVDFSLVSLSQVLEQLGRGSKTNIVFLDACRHNPFEKNLAKSMGTRAVGALGRGLSRVPSVTSTFIAFATEPDNVAADGDDGHSPFSEALLKHIQTPGESLSDLMIDVRKDVIQATGGKQVPWDSSSLTGRFAFAPSGAEPPQAPPPQQTSLVPAAPPADLRAVELAVWNAISSSNDVAPFQKYLRDFPDGVFAAAAQAKLASLSTAERPKDREAAPTPPDTAVAAIVPAPPPIAPPQAPPGPAPDSIEARILSVNVADSNYGEETSNFGVAAQRRLKSGALGAPTPTAIPGATTISTRYMQFIVGRHNALYVDVLATPHAQTIPGAIRLSALGGYPSTGAAERAKAAMLDRLTGGNKETPIAFFCVGARCWESYNAVLRAQAAGYRKVGWYRGGLTSWYAAGLPMQ